MAARHCERSAVQPCTRFLRTRSQDGDGDVRQRRSGYGPAEAVDFNWWREALVDRIADFPGGNDAGTDRSWTQIETHILEACY